MKIKVCFYGHCRKDGSINEVSFDTEAMVFCNKPSMEMRGELDVIVPTEKSKDTNGMRDALIADGYREIFAGEDDSWADAIKRKPKAAAKAAA